MSWNNRYENEKTAGIGQFIVENGEGIVRGLGHLVQTGLHDALHPFSTHWNHGTGPAGVQAAGEHASTTWNEIYGPGGIDSGTFHPTYQDYVQNAQDNYVNTNRHRSINPVGVGLDVGAAVGARSVINRVKDFIGYQPGGAKGEAMAVIDKLVYNKGADYNKLRDKHINREINRARERNDEY